MKIRQHRTYDLEVESGVNEKISFARSRLDPAILSSRKFQGADGRGSDSNYAPALAKISNIPAQYFVKGRAAAGQLAVFGSEPGEKDYNPLWVELFVKWNPGVTPVLLVRDDQINSLAAAHKLTVTDAHIVLNAPILTVGK